MNNSLIRFDKTYRIDKLPKLKSNSFIWNNLEGYTGSLIKRTIKISGGLYKHYGFIYGFDANDILWVIENNTDGVECVTYKDFLQGRNLIPEIEHNVNPNNCHEIMQRAFEKGFDKYDPRYNNCEHFINYCIYGEHKSMQTEFTEILASTLISAMEMRVNLSPRLSDHKILDQFDKTRNSLQLKHPEDMQKIFDERKKQLEGLGLNKKSLS